MMLRLWAVLSPSIMVSTRVHSTSYPRAVKPDAQKTKSVNCTSQFGSAGGFFCSALFLLPELARYGSAESDRRRYHAREKIAMRTLPITATVVVPLIPKYSMIR